MRRPNLGQVARHFIWWCVALVIVPLIVVFASVIVRSETMTHIGFVLLFWLVYPVALVLGHPIFDPALKTIPRGAPLRAFFRHSGRPRVLSWQRYRQC